MGRRWGGEEGEPGLEEVGSRTWKGWSRGRRMGGAGAERGAGTGKPGRRSHALGGGPLTALHRRACLI